MINSLWLSLQITSFAILQPLKHSKKFRFADDQEKKTLFFETGRNRYNDQVLVSSKALLQFSVALSSLARPRQNVKVDPGSDDVANAFLVKLTQQVCPFSLQEKVGS